MNAKFQNLFIALTLARLTCQPVTAANFEGRIAAALTRSGQATPLLYTVGTNQLRVEVTATDQSYAVNLLDLKSGERTLLFPNNRSFVRLRVTAENADATSAAVSAMSAIPPSIGPRTPMISAAAPAHIGPTNRPGMPEMPQTPRTPGGLPPAIGPEAGNNLALPQMPAGGMPAMPVMPPMMMEKTELIAAGDKTNLLGYACQKFEIKQRGEVMEIWATDELVPFQPYLQNQPHRFGPRRIEEQWGDLLKAKKLFPLLAVLRFQSPAAPGQSPAAAGSERLRFEVKSVTSEEIEDKEGAIFQPPPDYHELEPLPF